MTYINSYTFELRDSLGCRFQNSEGLEHLKEYALILARKVCSQVDGQQTQMKLWRLVLNTEARHHRNKSPCSYSVEYMPKLH